MYVYYLAVAYARQKQYDTALGYIDALLEAEADNNQAKALKEQIKSAMTHGMSNCPTMLWTESQNFCIQTVIRTFHYQAILVFLADGLIGAAIVGGGALALAGLVAIFSFSRK